MNNCVNLRSYTSTPMRSAVQIFFFAFFLTCAIYVNAQTTKEANAWFNKRAWAPAHLPKPHPSINRDAFYLQYRLNKELWDSAFHFLATQDLNKLAPGKYPIFGERVFASISEGPTKDKDSVKWESHRQYVDLHYIIRGEELIGLSDTLHATVTKPYSPDAQNYSTKGKYYVAKPGIFFLIFANDVHCANIRSGKAATEKKMVIKIEMAWPSSYPVPSY